MIDDSMEKGVSKVSPGKLLRELRLKSPFVNVL